MEKCHFEYNQEKKIQNMEQLENYLKELYNLKDIKQLKTLDNDTWIDISMDTTLSENEDVLIAFLSKYDKYVNWSDISVYQELTDTVMNKFFDKLNKVLIIVHQKLSEEFLNKHINDFDRNEINKLCEYQSLSERFIENNFDKLNITYVCQYQRLSSKFIEKHLDKLNLDVILDYQYIPESLRNKIMFQR